MPRANKGQRPLGTLRSFPAGLLFVMMVSSRSSHEVKSFVTPAGLKLQSPFPSEFTASSLMTVALQRSPKLTQVCSPKVDHTDFPRMTRASWDAHEAALLHLPSVVCAGPPCRPSPACVFGVGLSDRSPPADASLVAAA